VSLTTRPPGDATRPEQARPVAPAATGLGTSPSAAPVAAPSTPLRTPLPEGAAALRVFVEEVRAAAQAQLAAAVRPESAPALADAEPDPGNAVAALLRWLRAAAGGTPLPPATLRTIVEEAHARALQQMERAVAAAGTGRGEGPSAGRGIASTQPTATPPHPGPAVDDGSSARPADAIAGARATLAAARELMLRALVSPTVRGAADPAAPSARATGTPGGASSPRDAVPATLGRRDVPTGATAEARASALAGGLPRPAASALPPGAVPAAGAPPLAAAAGGRRVPALDAVALLRSFVDEVRVELARTIGAARLPSAAPPLVTDAQGAQLGPALLRWLTSAVGEKGVPLAPLQDAVRAAYGRAAALLPAPDAAPATGASGASASVAGPAAAGSASTLPARDALLAVRDHVLRGLGVAPERFEVAPTRDFAVPRLDGRVEPPLADPRGVPVGATLPALREDRVEEIDARPRARRDDAPDADDEATADERAAAADLQGPMDCIRRYFDAYLAADSAAYAAQWVYPACLWSGGRWSAYANATACARGNDEYTQAARAQGIVGGRIVMLRVEPIADDVAVVHGVFTRELADGTVAAEAEAAYTTVRTADGWRVAVCIVKQ
jgi:hypothetical protein